MILKKFEYEYCCNKTYSSTSTQKSVLEFEYLFEYSITKIHYYN